MFRILEVAPWKLQNFFQTSFDRESYKRLKNLEKRRKIRKK
jgi:hypothetical protein